MAEGAVDRVREREDKYSVEVSWAMPDLGAALPAGARVEDDVVTLHNLYLDTAAHALLENRVTLRRRTGDTDTGWQLKVPAGPARSELHVPVGDPGSVDVPERLRDLTAGLTVGAALAPVVTIDTRRTRRRVLAADGRLLAEIADDDVTATPAGRADALRWREVEVELGDAEGADEALLARLGAVLLDAGAQRAAGPSKLAHALGADRPAPPPRIRTVGDALCRYLDAQRTAILAGDLGLRLGEQPVHATRVAVRRYRSALRMFGDAVDAGRAAALDGELRWYAGVLGEVRDREVLRAHFADVVAALPPELVLGPVAARLDSTLLAEQAQARERVDGELRGERYLALLGELARWHDDPPLTARAGRRAETLRRRLDRAERTFRNRVSAARAVPPGQGDAAVHRARKAGKRLRYTAELAEPVLGKPARKVRRRTRTLQDLLGAHQDSVVARDLLLRLARAAGTTPGENGFTYGLLYAAEQQRARESFAQAARRLDR